MHRHLLATALILAAVPALALAAGQTPAASAKPHPSASAHANAAVGHADAARIEACGNETIDLLDAFDKGDYKTAATNFNPKMLSLVDAARFADVHKSVTTEFGKLESRGTPQSLMYEGMAVTSTPLHYTKGDLAAVIACDKDGKVAGFRLQPAAPGTPVVPAASD